MYVIYNEQRKSYKTSTGWTTITRQGRNGILSGLSDVLRFTDNEAEANADALYKGERFVYFPRRRWKDL
jgi:hypothetical protein